MLIVYGSRLEDSQLEMIKSRLEVEGIENEYIRRASKHGVMDVVRDGFDGKKPDVIVLADFEMLSGHYSAEEYVYMRYSRDVKIIPIISTAKKGTEYMRILLENGIYNALYTPDATALNIEHLIINGRDYKTSRAYYEV